MTSTFMSFLPEQLHPTVHWNNVSLTISNKSCRYFSRSVVRRGAWMWGSNIGILWQGQNHCVPSILPIYIYTMSNRVLIPTVIITCLDHAISHNSWVKNDMALLVLVDHAVCILSILSKVTANTDTLLFLPHHSCVNRLNKKNYKKPPPQSDCSSAIHI